jgi:hypothetical protein
MNLPSDDSGEVSRFVDVDRRACESGAIACDDHVDGMSNGSGNQDVVLKIRAAPFDSVAKDVTGHRHYLERLETNPNSVTLGTCVLCSVPSHEVGESVDAAGERAALDPTSAIWGNPGRGNPGRERFFTATENRSRPRFPLTNRR